MTPIPDTTQKQATAQGSVIYYRDGKSVLARQGVDRKLVDLAKVPMHVRQAVIAAENRSFYQDAGVSIKGTMRAVWSTVSGQQLQGGSTITQQLVRNYYSGLSQERSITRKFKEILIAMKVDQSKSKDWVLEQYLNTIYFGRGANGIQAAARAYFGKDVGDLTVAEGAYLAAVIQQPSRFADPKGADLLAAKARWQSVINAMGQTGALTAQQVAAQKFPELTAPKKPFVLKGQARYMLEQVTAELNRRGYSDEEINSGGLRVVTTFDKKLMAAAARAVKDTLPDGTSSKVRTGLAAVDPATGEIVAFYGGDPDRYQYDNAFSAKVMAGSTFKAYTLAAALNNGLSLSTVVNGNSPLRVASAKEAVPNDGGRSYGPIDLVRATQNSVNTAFVDLGQKVGLDKVAKTAEAAGIPADQLTQRIYPTFPLGVSSVSAVQNASGFSTFANKGVHMEAHVLKSVTDSRGRKEVVKPVSTKVIGEQAAADTTYALQQVVNYGTGTAARLYDRPVAGKTGTTDLSKSVWFNGYTPQLAVAVDMFRDDNGTVTIPGYGTQVGGLLPARIWRAFMTEAMDGKPVEEFPEPSDDAFAPDYSYSDPDPDEPPQDYTAPASPDESSTPEPQPSSTDSPMTEAPDGRQDDQSQPTQIPDQPPTDSGPGFNGDRGDRGGRGDNPPG
jgi:membrane peptidoglycan carboxypeptidase